VLRSNHLVFLLASASMQWNVLLAFFFVLFLFFFFLCKCTKKKNAVSMPCSSPRSIMPLSFSILLFGLRLGGHHVGWWISYKLGRSFRSVVPSPSHKSNPACQRTTSLAVWGLTHPPLQLLRRARWSAAKRQLPKSDLNPSFLEPLLRTN
jgi:hypothetical protein